MIIIIYDNYFLLILKMKRKKNKYYVPTVDYFLIKTRYVLKLIFAEYTVYIIQCVSLKW